MTSHEVYNHGMASSEVFCAAAHKCLSVRRKSLSIGQSVDLAMQVLAVDMGLKPALLYDSNGADVEQVQEYLISLQSVQLVSKSLLTLALSGNALIINPAVVMSNLEQLLNSNNHVIVINVCHSLENPSIIDPVKNDLRNMIQELLIVLRQFVQQVEVKKTLYVEEKCNNWNLCSLFGIVLGYPATYWFDQNRSFENCLAMTPLMVTKASATWKACCGTHTFLLYSFSIPAALHKDTQCNVDRWNFRLKERFQQQTFFSDLNICQSVVTLPSVCL